MAMLKFLKGNYAGLSAKAISEGQVLICGDTGEMFVDVSGSKRVKIGDFCVVADISALNALDATAVPTSRLYYVEDGNILARSDGTSWIQINKQKTLAELGGVAKTVYDAKISALEKADTDNASAISGVDTRLKAAEEKLKTVATADGLSNLTDRVTSAESDIDKLQAAIDVGGSVTVAIADAKKAGTDAATAAAAAQATADGKVSMAEVEAKNYATKTEAQGYANAKDSAIANAKQAGDDAQADVDALKTKVGTVPENKTVVQMISDAQAAATYDDTDVKNSIAANGKEISAIKADYLKASDKAELQNNINAVDDLVDTLIGSDTGKSARTIANEELAKQLIPEGAKDSLDTLTEIAAWIQSHPDDASAMNQAIVALQNKVGNIPEGASADTIVAYIQEVVNAEKARAEGAESGLDTRLDAIEAKFGDGEGNVSAQIAKAKSEAISTAAADATDKANTAKTDAIASAKTYTDTEVGKDRNRLATLEADAHTHENKAELDKIVAGDKAKWDAAQANAEATAAAALSKAKSELEGQIAAEATTARAAEKANADAIAVINGSGTGSIAKALADAKAYADAAETDAVNSANAYTDSALTWGSF